MTSSRYGSASKVEIVTIDTNTAAGLGLTVGASTAAGVDVAGTINGSAGIGDGRSLTGAPGNDVYGLKLEVTGGTSATLRYSRGFASQLVQMIQGVLDNNGTLDSRIDGLNASIKSIGEQREAMNRRLEQTEQRLRAQFVALDGLVAQLRSTSDYLTRQLANLPGAQAKG
ncbi:MAG: flagellar filament capping protein FliD [Gammaproteobacteria bacterium]|nr:flagellar filament capping protein FliD [Gammaproteobacteria bacterium]